MSGTTNLTNINFMSEEKFNETTFDNTQLYAVSTDFSHYAMPSNTFTALEILDSSSTYTISENGYIVARGTSTSQSQYISLENTQTGMASVSIATQPEQHLSVFLPVSKNAKVEIGYNINVAWVRFIPVNGAV